GVPPGGPALPAAPVVEAGDPFARPELDAADAGQRGLRAGEIDPGDACAGSGQSAAYPLGGVLTAVDLVYDGHRIPPRTVDDPPGRRAPAPSRSSAVTD